MSFHENSKEHLKFLAQELFSSLSGDEAASLNLVSEEQTYLRFNSSKLRQSTDVVQHDLQLEFQKSQRKMNLQFQLTGNQVTDLAMMMSGLERARAEVQILPEDPFLVPIENHGETQAHYPGVSPDPRSIVEFLAEKTAGTQFTGLLASGPLVRANINSKGQNHWFSNQSFFLDYSLYTVNSRQENKAVKGGYASGEWKNEEFLKDLRFSQEQLEKLKEPAISVPPGVYRAYLAPGAHDDLVQMMGWGALSFGAFKRGQSALAKLHLGEVQLSTKVNLSENYELGLGPQFSNTGEVSPTHLPLVQAGKLKNFLVSSRSAKEYEVADNGASLYESPRSLEMLGGGLTRDNTLKQLGTGVYLSNLHYCNWSDMQNARITGMTRYACFWVENGELAAPIKDMRFDESLFRIWGPQLEDLSSETKLIPATDTYGNRALGGKKIPGLLTREFRFTL